MVEISLVHQGALGDTVLLIPLFRALRERFADSCITVVTRTNLGQMLMMLGEVDTYTSADDREHSVWFAAPEARGVPNSLPSWAKCDYLLSAVSNGSDAWAENARAARPGRGDSNLFFQPRPPEDYPGHVTAWHMEQLASLQLKAPASALPRPNPDGAVLVHPGSGGDAKCWPRERFITLGRDMKRNGIVPTFILGEVEQERWGRQLMDEMKEEFPWYLHMGLYELAERMSRARLFIGNDSGVTHLAAAMGVPVISLFGPSNDVQWRPIGPSVKVLRAPQPNQHSLEALEESLVLSEILAELRKL